jgi:hypothetical protein
MEISPLPFPSPFGGPPRPLPPLFPPPLSAQRHLSRLGPARARPSFPAVACPASPAPGPARARLPRPQLRGLRPSQRAQRRGPSCVRCAHATASRAWGRFRARRRCQEGHASGRPLCFFLVTPVRNFRETTARRAVFSRQLHSFSARLPSFLAHDLALRLVVAAVGAAPRPERRRRRRAGRRTRCAAPRCVSPR